jgi:hypothetical protein
MDRPRRDSRQQYGITPGDLSQPTFATKSAQSGHGRDDRLESALRLKADASYCVAHRRLRRLAWQRRCRAFVNLGCSSVYFCLPDFSGFLQCPTHERVLGFFGQREQSITIWTIDLKSIAHATGFLPKHPLASASKLDFVVHDHSGTLENEKL